MNFHLEDQIVEIVIPHTDRNGNTVAPTNIAATLYDGEGAVLISWDSIAFDPAEVETRIILPGSVNRLQGEDLEEVRRLEVVITHAGGQATFTHPYGIEAEQSLQIMKNSFMTYETALMTARRGVNLTAFKAESEERQKAALVEAFHRITRLSMIYAWVDDIGNVISEHRLTGATWHYIDADAFQTNFPTHFKRALRDAQIAEADELLQGNVIARKHAQGIMSETIGESSVTLRAGFSGADTTSLGTAARGHLSGYLDTTVKIGRA